jgi:hypothetical protein
MARMTAEERGRRIAVRMRANRMRADLGLPPVKWPEIRNAPADMRPSFDAPAEAEHDFLRSLWRSFRGH